MPTNPHHGYLTEPRWFTARNDYWRDDSWRDTYDAWKLMSPDEDRDRYGCYGDEPEDECDHEDFETNSEGRRTCCRCDHSWWPTKEDIETEQRLQREYDEWQLEQERRERWDRLTWPFRWAWYRVLNRIWPRKSLRFLRDDEIPF